MTYAEKAKEARRRVLEMVYLAQKSHIGSNLSCIDILTVLFEKAKLTPKLAPGEDKLLVSKGWVAASFYYFLAEKGIIPKADLKRFCAPGEKDYIGLLEPTVKGVLFAGGSMGMGLAAGVGFALAKKMNKQTGKVYVLESDGGMQVGMVWESLAIAAHHRLDNLVLVIDANGIQAMGRTREVSGEENFYHKLRAFGWAVQVIDGHDYAMIDDALASRMPGKPFAIVANTIKGKGVSFMEDNLRFHYAAPTEREYQMAMKELE